MISEKRAVAREASKMSTGSRNCRTSSARMSLEYSLHGEKSRPNEFKSSTRFGSATAPSSVVPNQRATQTQIARRQVNEMLPLRFESRTPHQGPVSPFANSACSPYIDFGAPHRWLVTWEHVSTAERKLRLSPAWRYEGSLSEAAFRQQNRSRIGGVGYLHAW